MAKRKNRNRPKKTRTKRGQSKKEQFESVSGVTRKIELRAARRRKEAGRTLTIAEKELLEQEQSKEDLRLGQLGIGLGAISNAFIFATEAIGKKDAIRTARKLEGELDIENARRLDVGAENIIQAGNERATELARSGSQDASALRARLAGSGIQVDFGTGGEAVEDILEVSAKDASAIRTNAFRQAFNLRLQAADKRSRARQRRITSKAEEEETLLTGGLKTLRSLTQGVQKAEGFSSFFS